MSDDEGSSKSKSKRDEWLDRLVQDEAVSDTDVAICCRIYLLLGRLSMEGVEPPELPS